jgi:hypothetical protein
MTSLRPARRLNLAFHGDNSVLKRLVAFPNSQRLLGYQPTSAFALLLASVQSTPRANPNPERAEVRHTAFSDYLRPYRDQVRFNITTPYSQLNGRHRRPVNAYLNNYQVILLESAWP